MPRPGWSGPGSWSSACSAQRCWLAGAREGAEMPSARFGSRARRPSGTGVVLLIGTFFVLFGMVFVYTFAWDLDPVSEWRLAHSSERADAEVTEVQSTSMTENSSRVYRNTFQFD